MIMVVKMVMVVVVVMVMVVVVVVVVVMMFMMVVMMVMMMTCWQHSKVFLLQRSSHLRRQKLKLPPKGASAKPLVLKFIIFGVLSIMGVVISF